MGKVKNLEKKDKSATDFDKKNPKNRVKSINDEKLKKKQKQKNKKVSAVGGAVEKEVKPLAKEAKKEIAKALKAKKSLAAPDKASKEKPKVESTAELPEKLATRDVLKKAVKGLKDGIDKEKEAATTKTLFDDELRYGLQVVAVKIPKTPPHAKKILLENSLFDETPDICFIIRDQKAKKTEESVNEAIMKFEELLKEVGISGVKTILPLAKLKQDYGPHNMKLKLLHTYDVFLVESEIAEHAYTILGKHFIQKRKRPLQIDTSNKETFKHSFENAKRKVSFKVSSNSNFSIFEVGTYKMEESKIVDNISSAIDQLKEKWPGGWKNILRLYLKPMRPSKISIPIYYSKISPNDVEVPVEVGVKQTRLDKISEMLAKKSKKLRLNRKTKKVVKATGQSPPEKKEKGKDGKKDKKRKLESVDGTPVKTEAAEDQPAEAKKNKKRNNSETVVPVQAVEEQSQPKSKKKKKSSESGVIAEVPKKIKQQQSVSGSETAEKPDKKIKKKAGGVVASTAKEPKKVGGVVASTAEEPKKADKKIKKKKSLA